MCKQIISSQGKPCLISARLGMLRHIRSSLCEYNDLIKTLGLSMTKKQFSDTKTLNRGPFSLFPGFIKTDHNMTLMTVWPEVLFIFDSIYCF